MLVCMHTANATNYYISSSGNDANAGTSINAPWKTINKVNSFFGSIAAGDSILFKRGETFYGAIIANKSGTAARPVVISAYGTGAKPMITGMTSVSGWVSLGGNLWRSNAIPNVKNLDIVFVNNIAVGMGRYPNADAPGKGYLYFEGVSGKGTITDNQLPSSPVWTSAEIVIKPNPWTIGVHPVTNHSGTSITFTGNSNVIRNNYGYFIQNHLATLDRQGEWFLNKATKQLTMYSITAPVNVRASTIDTLCFVYGRDYITIKDLEFEGANQEGISLSVTAGVKIENCYIHNSGTNAIRARASVAAIVQNNILHDNFNGAVDFDDSGNSDGRVLNNKIARTGSVPGKGTKMVAINITGSGHVIQGNTIDSTGFNGIYFRRGNNNLIKNNVINTYCYVKSDGGGIYTWNNDIPVAMTYTGNKIIGNIILNGVGATEGTPGSSPDVDGIYMDDNTSNVEITDNTVANVAGAGMYIHNNFNMNIQRNTLYANLREQLNISHNLAYVNGTLAPYTTPLRNVTLKHNILFSRLTNQVVFKANTIRNDLDSTGVTDSNYYVRPMDDNITIQANTIVGGIPVEKEYNLAGWKTAYRKDAASKKSPVPVAPYTITGYTTSNLFSNGQYSSSISGTNVYSPNNNQALAWDNKVFNSGALRVSFPATVPNVYTSLYAPVGSTRSSSNYILRFSTVGTTDSGSLRVYLRQSASPFSVLSPIASRAFSKTKTDHEFLFTAPSADAAASILIEFRQNSGTTYIDNIEFYEANVAMTNADDFIKFVYNTTAAPVTMLLPFKYISVDSTVYNGTITLQPYSSKVLLKSGPIGGTLPVTLTQFSANNIEEKIQAVWETSSEINCSHYLVERSPDGRSFESAGRVNSLNIATRRNNYSFTDLLPLEGTSYYRLAMIDKDGSVSYSRTVAVTVKASATFMMNALALSLSNANLKFSVNSNKAQTLQLAMSDVSGRIILSTPLQVQRGANNIEKIAGVLSTGIYYVRLINNNEIITRPVMSQR